MPAILGLSMNGGRAPGAELADLTGAEDDDDDVEEDETAVAVVVVEEEEVGTTLGPLKPNRSGYM